MVQALRKDVVDLDHSWAATNEQFTTQVETLLRLNYPGIARMTEGDFLAEIEPTRCFFEPGALLVIPPDMVATPAQLRAIGGQYPADVAHWRHRDLPPLPTMPFVSLDVDDGQSLSNTSPRNCLARFKISGRLGLSVAEGIALFTHRPQLLARGHAVDLPGSLCEHEKEWHVAQLRRQGTGAILTFRYLWPCSPSSGSASCRARLAP